MHGTKEKMVGFSFLRGMRSSVIFQVSGQNRNIVCQRKCNVRYHLSGCQQEMLC